MNNLFLKNINKNEQRTYKKTGKPSKESPP